MGMRRADLMASLARASAFAKKLWNHRRVPKDMEPLCRPVVVIGLFKW